VIILSRDLNTAIVSKNFAAYQLWHCNQLVALPVHYNNITEKVDLAMFTENETSVGLPQTVLAELCNMLTAYDDDDVISMREVIDNATDTND